MLKKLSCLLILVGLNVSIAAISNNYELQSPEENSILIDNTTMLKSTNAEYLQASHSKELDQKMYEPMQHTHPSFIVLHYTVTTTIEQTMDTFYRRGVSTHYTIDRNGKIYQHIDHGNVAYHAGISFWRGKANLNWYSIGIEQINTGSDVDKWGDTLPAQPADDQNWETWSEPQYQAVKYLIAKITTEEQEVIKPWNIIGHGDIAPDRKVDPGPYYSWKKLHDEYEIGFWPDDLIVVPEEVVTNLKNDDYILLLHAFGYAKPNFISSVENLEELKKLWPQEKAENNWQIIQTTSNKMTVEQIIKAFQYHYLQEKFSNDISYRSQKLDYATKVMILKCISGIIIANNDANDSYSIRQLQAMLTTGELSFMAQDALTQILLKYTENLADIAPKKNEILNIVKLLTTNDKEDL